MSIARINSVEFDTPEQLQKRINWMEENYNHYRQLNDKNECLIQKKTSETSLLGILIYPDEETADEMLGIREEIMQSTEQKDSWFMDGEVMRFRINKTII